MQNAATLNIVNTVARISNQYKLNIIHSIESQSILDLILQKLECHNVYAGSNIKQVDWSLCTTTDCINNDLIIQHMYDKYVNGVALIDYLPMPYLKKEDLIILRNKMRNADIVALGDDIGNAWKLLDTKVIQPGIPKYDIKNHKRKSIILVSLQNKRQCHIIYEQILDILPDAGVMTDFDDLDTIAETLSMYKTALVLDGYTNVLFAAMCGCSIISNHNYGHKEIFTFNDSDSLNRSIQQSLGTYDPKINNNIRTNILEIYNMSIFDSELNKIFTSKAQEPFVV